MPVFLCTVYCIGHLCGLYVCEARAFSKVHDINKNRMHVKKVNTGNIIV